jgi:acyl-CoA synthetase (AMP-forming)/AMP-acid ligase II
LNIAHVETPNICVDFMEWAARLSDTRLFAFLDSKGKIVEDLTYADFAKRIDSLSALLLRRNGLGTGERVILAYQPGIEMVTALFACAKIGLIAIPTPPLSAFDYVAWRTRLDLVLKDSGASLMLTCSRTLEFIEAERAKDSAEVLGATDDRLVDPSYSTRLDKALI